jgi:hypothetical protein
VCCVRACACACDCVRACVPAYLPACLAWWVSFLLLPCQVNASHTLHHLSFGPEFEGMVFPLDGVTHAVKKELAHFQCVCAPVCVRLWVYVRACAQQQHLLLLLLPRRKSRRRRRRSSGAAATALTDARAMTVFNCS